MVLSNTFHIFLSKPLWRSCWIFMGQFDDKILKLFLFFFFSPSSKKSRVWKRVGIAQERPSARQTAGFKWWQDESSNGTQWETVAYAEVSRLMRFILTINAFMHAVISTMHRRKKLWFHVEVEKWKTKSLKMRKKILQSINQKVTNFSINYAGAVLISDFYLSRQHVF